MHTPLSQHVMHSPIGDLVIFADDLGIVSVHTQTPMPHVQYLPNITHHTNPHIAQCIQELDDYFAGKRQVFSCALSHDGFTPFQMQVFETMRSIPYGATLSYQDIAIKLQRPLAARAVGNACNRNPILILTPCHRVVGSDRSLKGFAAGKTAKLWLLQHEATHIPSSADTKANTDVSVTAYVS